MPSKVSTAEFVSSLGIAKITEKGDFERDECFRKWDMPFGFHQETHSTFWILMAHLGALSFFLCDFSTVPVGAIAFTFLYGYMGMLGITIGCHRYWTHKTFKAKLPLQILLMLCQTISMQYPIFKWCLDHRIHHKYTDTNADPHNSKRGFWYSHMMWAFLPKTKELEVKLQQFDMRDLEADPVVRFQSQYWYELVTTISFLLPTIILHYVWGVGWYNCLVLNFIRFVYNLHATFCVNSVAHMWGDKPYDRNISSAEVPVLSWFVAGEAFHNFHHTFPSEYQTSEFGWKINMSTILIDFFAKIGWAYDLKTVSEEGIKRRMMRTGNLKIFDEVTNGPHRSQQLEHNDFQRKLIGTAQSG